MKLLQFAVSSLVDGSTGNHLTRTSNRASQAKATQYLTSQNRVSILQTIRNTVTSVSRLASKLATANRQRLQRNKDTIQLLQLNAHYLNDIGLTYDDLADLKSGQKTLEGLNTMRSESQGSFNLRLKKTRTSKIDSLGLSAANQDVCELASCG